MGDLFNLISDYFYLVNERLLQNHYYQQSYYFHMSSLFYKFLTEENKLTLNKLQDQNILYYSELKSWYTRNAFRSFSLKYVVEGSIQYTTNHQEYKLSPGKILMASKQSDVEAFFETADPVKSICIDISTNTINEIFSFHTIRNDNYFEDFSAGLFKESGFVEKVLALDLFEGASSIRSVVTQIEQTRQKLDISSELFYHLAEKIVVHQYRNFMTNLSLPFSKATTRNEISRRLACAKEYMDDCFLHIKSNAEVARKCFLSEYHFMRSFSNLYKISPYQYLLAKRLDYAKGLIYKNNMSLTMVALDAGFPDMATFSKAFKKKYKISPSMLRKLD